MSQLKIKDNNNQWVDIPAGGVGVPSGGSEGQILQKSSNVDYATEWITPQYLPLMGIPDYANGYDVQALAVLNGTFTVPQNGYMHFTCLLEAGKTNCSYYVQLTKNSINYRNFFSWQGNFGRVSGLLPVSAGDILTVWSCENILWDYTGTLPNTTYYPKFIPCK